MIGRLVAAVVLAAGLVAVSAGCSAGPVTTSARQVVSDAEVNDARYQCLLDEGIPVTRGANGEVHFSDPEDEQTSAYATADRKCEQKLADRGLVSVSSPDALRAEWKAFDALHSCLLAQGFPLAPWPSEQVYVEKSGAFNVLSGTAPVDPSEARKACADDFAKVDRL